MKKGYNLRKVVVVGYGESAIEMAQFFDKNPEYGYKFEGFFDDNCNEDKIIGTLSNIKEYTLNNNIDEIYCLVPIINDVMVNDLIDFGENNAIIVKIIPEIKSYFYSKSKVDFYGNTPVLTLREYKLENAFNKFLKRSFDIIFSSLIICLVFSWLFPIIAIFIKLNSKGPVFFVQLRSGRKYSPFNCFKFRTMKFEKDAEFKQASKEDNRITTVGAFMRKTSIDELPQFFNVFLGNMSVVGPRPHPLKLDEEYKNIVNKYMSRHFVKPGITGLSQVMGYRGETKLPHLMKGRVKLDNFYIENWSFLLDIKIIVKTAFGVVKNDENAF